MQKKLPLKDILAAIDLNAKDVWDELSDEERKQVSFYLLNRYVSSVKSTREKAELAVFKTNEYYNKGFFVLQKHKKLLWQLLCMSGNTGKIQYHEWIGYKHKKTSNKDQKELEKIYPNMKEDELQLMLSLMTKKEFKELLEQYA
tara:strand:+ start:21787 stop:22218 length:432 start_codon:yes stop_codon:yes gene_type:complete